MPVQDTAHLVHQPRNKTQLRVLRSWQIPAVRQVFEYCFRHIIHIDPAFALPANVFKIINFGLRGDLPERRGVRVPTSILGRQLQLVWTPALLPLRALLSDRTPRLFRPKRKRLARSRARNR